MVASLTGLLFVGGEASAADTRKAESVLISARYTAAPGTPLTAYSATYGTAGTPDLTRPSGAVDAVWGDPIERVIVKGTKLSATSWDENTGQLTARSNITGLDASLAGKPGFLTMGSVDNYVNCLRGQGNLAYAHSDSNLVFVAGKKVTGDKAVTVKGSDIGLADVGQARLRATYTRYENVVNTPTEASAEAYVRVTVTGELRNKGNDVVYDGPLLDLTVGHVSVVCEPRVTPEPTPTSSSPTAEPSTVPPTTAPPTSNPPTESPSPSESPSESPSASPSTSPSESPSPSNSPSGSPSVSPSPSVSESPSESPSPSPSESSSSPSPSPSTSASSSASASASPSVTPPSSSAAPVVPTTTTGTPLPTTGADVATIGLIGGAVAGGGVMLIALIRRREPAEATW